MTTMTTITTRFEGRALTTINYQGRPCWIARDVGETLGYEQGGRRLVSKISGDWAEDFVEGVDFARVEGDDLRDLKAALGTEHRFGALSDSTDRVGPDQSNTTDTESRGQSELIGARARSVLVLFESGVYAVCLKTDKPEGRRLRRFLVDEVLPQLARTGRYEPGRKTREPRRETADEREARLRRKLEHDIAKFKRQALLEFAAAWKDRLSPEALQTIHVKAAEYATGEPMPALLPVLTERWESPGQIAARHEFASPGLIGTIISRIPSLRERGDKPGLIKAVLNQARGGKQVTSYLYSEQAVKLIEAELAAYFESDAGKKAIAAKRKKAAALLMSGPHQPGDLFN